MKPIICIQGMTPVSIEESFDGVCKKFMFLLVHWILDYQFTEMYRWRISYVKRKQEVFSHYYISSLIAQSKADLHALTNFEWLRKQSS